MRAAAFLILFLLPGLASANDWDALEQPGAMAIMRHALAPGTGDPSEFRLGDCATQRNLDARGREQATERLHRAALAARRAARERREEAERPPRAPVRQER